MNVYITYDRYEHDEWLSVFNIETNKERAQTHFIEEDLPDFLSYGPDDCHSFQLQRVKMTKEEYHRLCDLVDREGDKDFTDEEAEELRNILINVFENCDWNSEDTIFQTDGCSDISDLPRFYCMMNGLDDEDEDIIQEVEEKIFNDEELFDEVLREYIRISY